MTTTNINIPNRTLADTNTTHRDDHNAFAAVLNEVSSWTFIEPSGNATTDTPALQAAFDQGPGVGIMIGPGQLKLNTRVRYKPNTKVFGAGIGDNADRKGTCILWSGASGIGQYRGMIESYGYANNDSTKDTDVQFENLQIHGNNSTTGGGFINWGGRTHIEHCSFYGFDGTTAGNGRGLWLAGQSLGVQLGTGGVSLSGGENCYIRDCRFTCLREGFLVDATADVYTDGYISDCEWMTTTQAGETRGVKGAPQCAIYQGGGWVLRALHCNGSPGDFIAVDNAMHMIIADCYVDGFGCAQAIANGDRFAGIHVKGLSNGDGGREIIIRNNTMRHRTQQSGVTANWPAIWVDPTIPTGYDANVVIQGNNDHVRGGADLSRQYFLQLESTGGASKVQYAVTGNCPTADNTGSFSGSSRGFDDGHVFAAPADSNNVEIIQAGNSWQLDDAKPVAGFWPKNTIRYNSTASANGDVWGWVNTANGTPGTWKNMGVLS